mmetsp:Transcript_8347/g.23354  ORF Transcript_8347/g.23354 Transcript_8347/m.23354 type:complete len:217 (-) Transcript_8347:494-1144(-)
MWLEVAAAAKRSRKRIKRQNCFQWTKPNPYRDWGTTPRSTAYGISAPKFWQMKYPFRKTPMPTQKRSGMPITPPLLCRGMIMRPLPSSAASWLGTTMLENLDLLSVELVIRHQYFVPVAPIVKGVDGEVKAVVDRSVSISLNLILAPRSRFRTMILFTRQVALTPFSHEIEVFILGRCDPSTAAVVVGKAGRRLLPSELAIDRCCRTAKTTIPFPT